MPALFVFLLKVNVALLLFCAGYYLVLRHLTFYTLNRIYLMGAILFASIYPKINLSGFLERHQQIARPVQDVVLIWQAPASALVKPISKPDYWQYAEIVLWAGVILFALRLLVQFFSLYKLYRSSTAGRIHDHDVRIITGDSGPFSFWKSIFINPSKHEPGDLRSILQHEQVHVNELHTMDILLAELSTVFYWFNPGIWLMKKAVRENIEFITDRKILKNGTDSKEYQYSLVNVSFSAAPQGIVNHFNISTIKKRIIMMNAKRSSKFKLTRYAFLVPAVVALLLIFSISKAALVKKNGPIVKAFSALTAKTAEKPAAKPIANKNTNASETAKIDFVQKTIAKTDTIRKGGFFASITGSDSVIYMINGVRATKADIQKLDEKSISSVNAVSGSSVEKFRKIVPGLDGKHGVIFFNTNDETGRAFEEKLRDAAGTRNYTARAIDKMANISYRTPDDSEVYVVGSGSKNGTSSSRTYVLSGKLNAVRFKADSLKSHNFTTYSYSVNDSGAVVKKPMALQLYTAAGTNNSPRVMTWASSQSSKFSLDHIDDKLIVINGKTSTHSDLKKISAFDIDKVVFKNDEETKELYGDSARNGIVFIVTKKAKK
ncbi:MAG TPA: M56 family metallopeptidase [Mucilaginibacter sp.]